LRALRLRGLRLRTMGVLLSNAIVRVGLGVVYPSRV
jgi:hypothetical protein